MIIFGILFILIVGFYRFVLIIKVCIDFEFVRCINSGFKSNLGG